MPPLKTYTFKESDGSKCITITMDAYNFEQAMNILVQTVKHPADFKCTSI